MEILNQYFETLIFTKVDSKEGFFVYAAKIYVSYGGGLERYILLFVPLEFAPGNKAKIYDLRWKNLQTRELKGSYRLKSQRWRVPDVKADFLLKIKNRYDTYSTFEVENNINNFSFEILLLHNPKKKTIYQYNNHVMLSSAIESFSSIFNYTGDIDLSAHTVLF
ncbi:hypothetical protein OAG24_01065 [bacterium]|nr:hypothetical protein [bacterium]